MAGSLSDPAILRQRRAFPAALAVTTATAFIGPIPPPQLLLEYEQTLPGLADRLVAIAERESDHRRALQRRAIRRSELGLAAGFTIAMTALTGGIFLVHEGSQVEGMSSIILAIASLVLVFLTRGKRHPGDAAPASAS
ncbi:MAG TPA: DUF2335 domain-containing protein [Longimicrobium sp.]|nr:DUF2335 domain-containing protein [Longimicrobium sp.]